MTIRPIWLCDYEWYPGIKGEGDVVFSCQRTPTGDSEHVHNQLTMGAILIGDVAELLYTQPTNLVCKNTVGLLETRYFFEMA